MDESERMKKNDDRDLPAFRDIIGAVSDERVDIEELRRVVRRIAYSTTYTRRVEKNLLSAFSELERLRDLEDDLEIPYTTTNKD